MEKIRLYFMVSEPTPYLNLLFKAITTKDVSLVVYYLSRKQKHHPWEISQEPEIAMEEHYCRGVLGTLIDIYRDMVRSQPTYMVVGGYKDWRNIGVFMLNKILGVRFGFWSDTQQLHNRRSMVKKTVRAMVLHWLFNNAEIFFSTGNVGTQAYKMLGCPEKKLRNLPWAVELEAPAKVSPGAREYAVWIKSRFAPKGEIIFLVAGQLIRRKGYDVALCAFAQALHQNKGKPGVLLIAGEGPARQELENLAGSLGIIDQVHFLGWQQPDQMQGLFHAADILVHPARWDPYPVAVLEAMSWSMPVLASNQTMAAVDRVCHGENGFIHQVDKIGELSDHISYLLENPVRILDMGIKARQTAEEWPVSRCVQTILEVI